MTGNGGGEVRGGAAVSMRPQIGRCLGTANRLCRKECNHA